MGCRVFLLEICCSGLGQILAVVLFQHNHIPYQLIVPLRGSTCSGWLLPLPLMRTGSPPWDNKIHNSLFPSSLPWVFSSLVLPRGGSCVNIYTLFWVSLGRRMPWSWARLQGTLHDQGSLGVPFTCYDQSTFCLLQESNLFYFFLCHLVFLACTLGYGLFFLVCQSCSLFCCCRTHFCILSYHCSDLFCLF